MTPPCIKNYTGQLLEVLDDDDTVLGWELHPPLYTSPDNHNRHHKITFIPHQDRDKSHNRHNGYMLLSSGKPHELAESLCRAKLKTPFKITIARKTKLIEFNKRIQGQASTIEYDTYRRWKKIEDNGAMCIANRIIAYHSFLETQLGTKIDQKALWQRITS